MKSNLSAASIKHRRHNNRNLDTLDRSVSRSASGPYFADLSACRCPDRFAGGLQALQDGGAARLCAQVTCAKLSHQLFPHFRAALFLAM